MARSDRILDLLQTLRNYRNPVSGEQLAAILGISLRTLYRDIATLRAQGADIRGEPGMGYLLKSGFMLPTMMFSEEELEALILGARWVSKRGDGALAEAATSAVNRLASVLPERLRAQVEENHLLVAPPQKQSLANSHLKLLRDSIRRERKLSFDYVDLAGKASHRTVWPFALGYFDQAEVLICWCEQRLDIRHFRTDRMTKLLESDERYPRRKAALLKDWRQLQEKEAAQRMLPVSGSGGR